MFKHFCLSHVHSNNNCTLQIQVVLRMGGIRAPPLWHHQSSEAHPRDDLTTAVHEHPVPWAASSRAQGRVSCTFIWKPGVKLRIRISQLSTRYHGVRRSVGIFGEPSRGAGAKDFHHLLVGYEGLHQSWFSKRSLVEPILFSLEIHRRWKRIWFPCRLWDNSCVRANEEQEPQLFNHFKSVKKLAALLHRSDTDSCDLRTWEPQILIHHV